MTQGIEFNADGMPFDQPAPHAPSTPELPGDTVIPEGGVLQETDQGYAEANVAAFEPRGIHEYRFEEPDGAERSVEDVVLDASIRQTLLDIRFPPFAANVVFTSLHQDPAKAPQDEAGMCAAAGRCSSTLATQHGQAVADTMIAEAQRALDRFWTAMTERGRHAEAVQIFDSMKRSGAANDVRVIEALARAERDYYAKRR